jgi:DHA1 family tetracycline resistance protein-like MFS transporter
MASDEAERVTGPWVLPILLSLVFLSIIGYGVVVPLLPFYGRLFHAPAWQVALLFTAFAVGQLSGELVWGPMSDRIGRRPVLLVTIFCSALGYVLLAVAPNVWIAIAARLASGVFSGNISTIQSYMSDVSPRERLPSRMGLISGSMGVALVAGPAIGGLLAEPSAGVAGFARPVVLSAVLCGVAAVLALVLLRESRRPGGAIAGRRGGWRLAATDGVLRRLLAVSFLAYVAFAVLNSTLGLWGQDRFGWSPRHVGGLMAVTGASMAITQIFIAGRVARRIGEPRTVMLGMASGCVALLLLPLIPGDAWAIPCLVLSTVGMSLYQPSTISLVSDRAGPERRGAILGVNAACGALGRVTGPLAAGALMSGVSLSAPFFLGSAAMLAGGLLAASAAGRLMAAPPVIADPQRQAA